MGTVVTFYSYKGGVGRSMALANVAVLLAQRGHRVLAIDWDLEAPGLERYFEEFHIEPQGFGLLRLLDEASGRGGSFYRKWVWSVNLNLVETIDLIPSGRDQDASYANRLESFVWDDFFRKRGGGEFIENMRAQWKVDYDFILIDSRTGLSDAAGICTILLPDVVVAMFTANYQSLYGTRDIMRLAQQARQGLAHRRMALTVLPLPARFPRRAPKKDADSWLERFAEAFGEFINDWLPRSVEPERALDTLKVPQVDEFGFGERLAVNRSDSSAKKLAAAYTYVASLLDTDFTKAADSLRLKENPLTRRRRGEEENVQQRKVADTGYKYDVYISYKQDPVLSQWTSSLLLDLRSVWKMPPNKVSVFWDAQELAVGSTLDEITKDRVARSKVLLAILTPGYARSFATALEWRTFELREKFTAKNLILPLLCDGDMSYYPEWIKKRLWIDMRDSASTYGGERRHELIDIVAFELDKMLSAAPRYDDRWPVASPSEVEEMIVSLW